MRRKYEAEYRRYFNEHNPCTKDCPDRNAGCHGSCKKYEFCNMLCKIYKVQLEQMDSKENMTKAAKQTYEKYNTPKSMRG